MGQKNPQAKTPVLSVFDRNNRRNIRSIEKKYSFGFKINSSEHFKLVLEVSNPFEGVVKLSIIKLTCVKLFATVKTADSLHELFRNFILNYRGFFLPH